MRKFSLVGENSLITAPFFFSQEKKQGRLTSNGPGLYSFISAQTYMSEESVEEITAKADKIADASSNPTFKAQSEWLKRANIPDLEYVYFPHGFFSSF